MARLLLLSLLARSPITVLGLLFLLRTREMGGSYAVAGLASAAAGLGMAIGSPVLGRAIDRHGPTGVLLLTVAVSGSMLIVGGLLPSSVPSLVLLPLAFAGGFCQPPVAPCLRTLFGQIVPDPTTRHAALAVEASVQEMSFMLGPLLFVSVLAAHDPRLGMVCAGAALLVATTIFARSREARSMPATGVRRAAGAGPLRAVAIRALLAMSLGLGFMFGAAEVAITATAEHSEHGAALGLLLAAYCIGSLAAGLFAAHHGTGARPLRQLVLLLIAATVGHGLLAVAPGLIALGVLLILAGAAVAPLFAITYSLCGQLAPKGTLTEAYTWLSSGLFAGAALGSAGAGGLISLLSPEAAFVGSSLAAGLATVVAVRSIGSLRGGRDARPSAD